MGISEFNAIFSRNLRRFLIANNMTQLELSKRLGVGTTSVSNWCLGVKVPRMDKVDAMCLIFNCKRSDLMDEHIENPNANINTLMLSPDQEELLSFYNKLNASGKQKIREYASDLTEQKKYIEAESSGKQPTQSA